jgi:hypothetical protein
MRSLQQTMSSEDYIRFHKTDFYLADAVRMLLAKPESHHLYGLATYFIAVTRGTHAGAGREYAYISGTAGVTPSSALDTITVLTVTRLTVRRHALQPLDVLL